MRKIYFTLLLLLVFTCSAEAASFKMSTTTINYSEPPGYKLLTQAKYPTVLNAILNDQQSEEYWAVAVLVPSEILTELDRTNDPVEVYSNPYILVGYVPALKDQAISKAEFSAGKAVMLQEISKGLGQKMKEGNQALKAAGESFWLDVRSIDSFGDTDTSVSIVMLYDVKLGENPSTTITSSSIVLSPILIEDRVIMLTQSAPLPVGKTLDDFKNETFQLIKDMNFSLGAAEVQNDVSQKAVPSAVDAMGSVLGSVVWVVLAATVAAMLFALLIYFLRRNSGRKEKKHTELKQYNPDGQSDKNPFEE